MTRALLPALLLALAGLAACAPRPSTRVADTKDREPSPPSVVRPTGRAAAFSAQRAWLHLEDIVALGPRLSGHPGQRGFRELVRRHLVPLGWSVTEIPFTYQVPGEPAPRQLANVCAVLGRREAGWIAIGSHYDTRPWAERDPEPARRNQPIPGANDGGSGVAVMLEIGRVLAEQPPDVGVELMFFDGEDLGREGRPREYSAGARHLADNWETLRPGVPWPEALVVIDMVGDVDLRFYPEAASLRRFPALTRRIWQAGRELGHEEFVAGSPRSIYDDHQPFLERGVNAALVIDLDYRWWHTLDDTLDKCSAESLEVTGQTLLHALF